MLSLPSNVRLFLADNPVDFRKSFDGLRGIVEGEFGMSVRGGDIFIFLNRRGNQVKLLFWERDGLCLVIKRLEAGTFRRIRREGSTRPQIEIDAAELALLLEGVEVQVLRRRKRYVDNEEVAHVAQ